jgi:adenylate kinase
MKTRGIDKAALPAAVLLLGPTGSGKTPLGQRLERGGLAGRPCRHFDFGANLRRLASLPNARASGMTRAELDVIGYSLATGALLEDEHFPVAKKILARFLGQQKLEPGGIVILNGFPRHTGQAKRLEPCVDVRLVVYLKTLLPVIRHRIRTNADGDRAGRTDDALADIERKLVLFERRTLPLMKYYAARGVRIITMQVTRKSRATGLAAALNRRLHTISGVF